MAWSHRCGLVCGVVDGCSLQGEFRRAQDMFMEERGILQQRCDELEERFKNRCVEATVPVCLACLALNLTCGGVAVDVPQ